MMLKELEILSTQERQLLEDAIPYITILVAGADGKIDPKEKQWSERLTNIRAFADGAPLHPFYKRVGEIYEERLQQLLSSLPKEVEDRKQIISDELAKLNPVFSKLDPVYAYLYYKSLKSFADHVARATGGIMGWLSIGFEEYKVVDLPMINPVTPTEEEEE